MLFHSSFFPADFPHLKLPKLSAHSQPASPPVETKSEASLASRVVLEVAGLDYVILSDPTSQSDRGKQQNSQGEAQTSTWVRNAVSVFFPFFTRIETCLRSLHDLLLEQKLKSSENLINSEKDCLHCLMILCNAIRQICWRNHLVGKN